MPDRGDGPWWRDAVVYQIYPRSFADGDGDGIGDLRGIVDHLDHVADLGADVIWLSPVYPSPMDDNGYDISDYRDVDPLFGTLDDLDDVIAGVHDRGMRLIMDLVVNHTSDEHPWFEASRSSRDDPKRDWYWWRPPRAGHEPGTPGAEPTNWRSFFSGPAWRYDERTGEYYLHLFSRKQPDLNWENPAVRAAVHEMMRWWLDRGVDGFRMDVVNLISKDPALPDGEVAPGARYGDGSPSYVCGPRIHEFLHGMHTEVFAPHRDRLLIVGEMPGVSLEDAVLFTDPAREEVDMVFQFEHIKLDQGETKWDVRPLDLRDLKRSLGRWQAGLADRGWNSLYFCNHDQPRIVSRWGDDGVHRAASAKALATLLHLHRGTPYVYQGEELGMANLPIDSVDDLRDIESLNHHADALARGADPDEVLAALRVMSRDHARTPMQWDGSEHAGFTTGTPWIAVNPDHERVNVAVQRHDPDSVLAHFRRLIELRHTEPAVVDGRFAMLLEDHPAVYAFTRATRDAELLVVVNVSGEEQVVHLPDDRWYDAEPVLVSGAPRTGSEGTDPDGWGDPAAGARLAPWEARVHRRPAPG